jgi:hypothetical protein
MKKANCQMVIGHEAEPDAKAFSAEVVYNVLDKLHLGDLRPARAEPLPPIGRAFIAPRVMRE